jgi:glycosyltransferase involved in cell wall biosynthesis
MDSSNQPGSKPLIVESAAEGFQGSHASAVTPSLPPRRKVFFLLDSLNVGGTETQAVELATRLDSDRYDVTLGCLRARGPLLEKLAGTTVCVREFYPKGGFDSVHGMYQMFRLAIFLRRGGFQIVHTHDLYANLLGIPAAVIARVPVIISSQRDLAHLDLYKTRRRVWLRRLQNLSTAVLTNANAVRDAVLAENHFAPQKVRVIHNGVDMERFSHASRGRGWLTASGVNDGVHDGVPDKEKWIVLVGNMHSDVKGHPWLIGAAGAITREFPEVRFILVGDGAERKNFELQVAELGLEKSFLFLGRRDDVPAVLACCDIAVLPSKAEGLPNAVLEYLAVGLPTVASRVGGNAEIVQDGKTGLLVPPEDSSALAEALLRLLRDPGLAASLGKNGREYVASEFSFQRMIQNTDRLYTELLRSRGVE